MLQSLYEAEFSEREWKDILAEQAERRSSSGETVDYAGELLSSVLEHVADLDEKIRSAVEHWEFDRISLVDKNILRLALAEILFFPDVPSVTVINEAIEIAHKYSSGDAGKFVNGILDRMVHEYRWDAK